MKKFSRFLTTIVVFVTVFAFSCMPIFAADTVDFAPTWYAPTWNFRINSLEAGIGRKLDGTSYTYGNGGAIAFWNGTVTAYTNNQLSGGYSYSGTLAVNFNATFNTVISGTIPSYKVNSTYGSVTSVEFVIDGQSYQPFLTKTSLTGGTAYFTVKDLYVSTTSRVLLNVNFSGYTNLLPADASGNGALETNVFHLSNLYVGCTPSVTVNGSYVMHGTTSGFNDNINKFDDAMNEGTQKEDSLSNKAIGDINSFEFKDIKDDSSILSSLTFYSSVINLAYGSLGSTVQTLFAVSFGVLIVIFILRIRRDSS